MASDVMAVEEMNQATNQSQIGSKLLLIAASAAVIAVMVVVWLWSKQPDYRILFSNYSE
jgi:flagellar M-ring protein FliF